MRVIARKTLLTYAESLQGRPEHRAVKSALDAWYAEVRKANWRNSAEVKAHYRTASIVSADRVVFNIKGNDHRLVAAIDFERSLVWIKWLGTHEAYDKIDVRKVTHEKR